MVGGRRFSETAGFLHELHRIDPSLRYRIILFRRILEVPNARIGVNRQNRFRVELLEIRAANRRIDQPHLLRCLVVVVERALSPGRVPATEIDPIRVLLFSSSLSNPDWNAENFPLYSPNTRIAFLK